MFQFLLLLTALLTYNSYSIQFISLEYTIQCFGVFTGICKHHHNFKAFPSTQKETHTL